MSDEKNNQDEVKEKSKTENDEKRELLAGLFAAIIAGSNDECSCGKCNDDDSEKDYDPNAIKKDSSSSNKEKVLEMINSGNPFILISTQYNHNVAEVAIHEMREQDVIATLEIAKSKIINKFS